MLIELGRDNSSNSHDQLKVSNFDWYPKQKNESEIGTAGFAHPTFKISCTCQYIILIKAILHRLVNSNKGQIKYLMKDLVHPLKSCRAILSVISISVQLLPKGTPKTFSRSKIIRRIVQLLQSP